MSRHAAALQRRRKILRTLNLKLGFTKAPCLRLLKVLGQTSRFQLSNSKNRASQLGMQRASGKWRNRSLGSSSLFRSAVLTLPASRQPKGCQECQARTSGRGLARRSCYRTYKAAAAWQRVHYMSRKTRSEATSQPDFAATVTASAKLAGRRLFFRGESWRQRFRPRGGQEEPVDGLCAHVHLPSKHPAKNPHPERHATGALPRLLSEIRHK